MQYEVVISPSRVVQTRDHGNGDSAFVECMYGMVSCLLWTNRKYVYIAVCLNLKVPVIGIRYIQYDVAISRSCAVQITTYNGGDDGSVSLFVCCM